MEDALIRTEEGERRDLPVGPTTNFLPEIVDRAIALDEHLVVGATAHPDTLRDAFVHRCEAAGEQVEPVHTHDLEREVERFRGTRQRIHTVAAGNYV